MEKYIISKKNFNLACAINRLANVAKWYLEEHPDMKDTRDLISVDVAYIAEHIDD